MDATERLSASRSPTSGMAAMLVGGPSIFDSRSSRCNRGRWLTEWSWPPYPSDCGCGRCRQPSGPHFPQTPQVEGDSQYHPFRVDVGQPAQEESVCSLLLLEYAESRFRQLLALAIRGFCFLSGHPGPVTSQEGLVGSYLKSSPLTKKVVHTPKAGHTRHTAPEARYTQFCNLPARFLTPENLRLWPWGQI